MSRSRIPPAPYDGERAGRGPNGRRLCRWCGTEVPAGRITWCSDSCVEEYRLVSDPGHIRNLVSRRDKGVCASCGTDTKAVLAEFRALENRVAKHPWGDLLPWGTPCQHVYDWQRATANKRRDELNEWLDNKHAAGWDRHRFLCYSEPWDADHIDPVCEGGGGCGLDGYQTLCLPCHKAKSKTMHARQAQERRLAKGQGIQCRLPGV